MQYNINDVLAVNAISGQLKINPFTKYKNIKSQNIPMWKTYRLRLWIVNYVFEVPVGIFQISFDILR